MSRKGEPERRKAYDWIKPGEPCWFQPNREMAPFEAIVISDLIDMDGTLCVRLRVDDPRYLKLTGRTMMGCAQWWTLRPREVEK